MAITKIPQTIDGFCVRWLDTLKRSLDVKSFSQQHDFLCHPDGSECTGDFDDCTVEDIQQRRWDAVLMLEWYRETVAYNLKG